MNSQSWPTFDETLRIKLQADNEPKKQAQRVDDTENLANSYEKLTSCVYETIKEIVPEQKWIKKNGRVVSEETKKLFEQRTQEF